MVKYEKLSESTENVKPKAKCNAKRIAYINRVVLQIILPVVLKRNP